MCTAHSQLTTTSNCYVINLLESRFMGAPHSATRDHEKWIWIEIFIRLQFCKTESNSIKYILYQLLFLAFFTMRVILDFLYIQFYETCLILRNKSKHQFNFCRLLHIKKFLHAISNLWNISNISKILTKYRMKE